MNSTNKILELNNISKTYYSIKDEVQVLNDISFDVYKNDFIGIIGPSGCGKSSILNIISNLDIDYKGKITKLKDLKIGYMFQEDTLFPWLTIYENAILPLTIAKKKTKENLKYVENLLIKYNLYDFKNKYPNELSGGMKQRLSLIRTLSSKPDLLLLDEPYSALDYQTRLNVSNDVYKIIKEEQITAIIVTHDIEEAISMCNKIIVLSNRPTQIKNTHIIKLTNNKDPISNRKTKEFPYYLNIIWKELNTNDT